MSSIQHTTGLKEDAPLADILDTLKCPTCLEYMTPPITLCEDGHNNCHRCRPKLAHCQSCEEPILGVRNTTLETIAKNLEVDCKFKPLGCDQTFRLDGLRKHQATCAFREHACPLKSALDCAWTGRNALQHVTSAHPDRIVTSDVQIVTWDAFSQAFDQTHTQVMFEHSEIFLYHRAFDSVNRVFSSAVQHLGLEEMAKNFKYHFELYSKEKRIKKSFDVNTEKENVDDIFSCDKCVRLEWEAIDHFVEMIKSDVEVKSRISVSPAKKVVPAKTRRVSTPIF